MPSRRFSRRRCVRGPGSGSSTSAAEPVPPKSAWRACGCRRCTSSASTLVTERVREARRHARHQRARRLRGRRRVPPAVCRRLVRLDVLRRRAAAHPRLLAGARRDRARDASGRPRAHRRTGQRGALLVQLGAERHGGVRARPALLRRAVRQCAASRRPRRSGRWCLGCSRAGVEPVSVRLFPVSVRTSARRRPRSGKLARTAVRGVIAKAPDESLRRLGADFLKAIDQYARDARSRRIRRSSKSRTRCSSRRSDSAPSEAPAATPSENARGGRAGVGPASAE